MEDAAKKWYYEENGGRKGPVTEPEMTRLINNGTLTYGSSVWKNDMPEWSNIEQTSLQSYLKEKQPPPLPGKLVSNTIIWILAFAPLIGLMLEYIISGIVHDHIESVAVAAAQNGDFWYVTLILNILLAYSDEKRLTRAGYDTAKFRGWIWLVPVYLYQRAKALKHNLAYFIVWIICFILAISA